jgi:hypothetical protein
MEQRAKQTNFISAGAEFRSPWRCSERTESESKTLSVFAQTTHRQRSVSWPCPGMEHSSPPLRAPICYSTLFQTLARNLTPRFDRKGMEKGTWYLPEKEPGTCQKRNLVPARGFNSMKATPSAAILTNSLTVITLVTRLFRFHNAFIWPCPCSIAGRIGSPRRSVSCQMDQQLSMLLPVLPSAERIRSLLTH